MRRRYGVCYQRGHSRRSCSSNSTLFSASPIWYQRTSVPHSTAQYRASVPARFSTARRIPRAKEVIARVCAARSYDN
eukprot:299518-Rhodomonas_salina.2